MPAQARQLRNAASPITITVTEAIYSRRAVRSYRPKAVTEEQIYHLLDAAVHAPSAMNSQPWAFVVIQRPELLSRISRAAKGELLKSPGWLHSSERGHVPIDDPSFDIFYGATTLVVICMREGEGFSPLGDCYLAAQNLMLAAYEQGLATCPIGLARDILREPPLKDEVRIPRGYVPVLPIIIGYAGKIGQSAVSVGRMPPRILNWLR